MSKQAKVKSYTIYKITFTDTGHCYVGITRKRLKARINQHRWRQSNHYLHMWLNQHRRHTVERLATTKSKKQALLVEQQQISLLIANGYLDNDLLLNRTFSFKTLTDNNLTNRKARCSWHNKELPRAKFGTDSGRHNGLNSRCKDCINMATRMTGGPRYRFLKAKMGLTEQQIRDKISHRHLFYLDWPAARRHIKQLRGVESNE